MSLIAHYTLDNQAGIGENILTHSCLQSPSTYAVEDYTHGRLNNLCKVIKLSQSGNTSYVYRGYGSIPVSGLKGGDIVTLSMWLYIENGMTFDGGTELRIYQTKSDGNTDWTSISFTPQYDKWFLISRTYTISSLMTAVYFNIQIPKNGTLWVTCPKLEFGSTVTAWVPYKTDAAWNNAPYNIEANIVQSTTDVNNHTPKNNLIKTGTVFDSDSPRFHSSTYSNTTGYMHTIMDPTWFNNNGRVASFNCWIKILGYVGSNWNTIFRWAAADGTDKQMHMCFSSTEMLLSHYGDDKHFNWTPSLNTWYMVTWVHSGLSSSFYLNGQLIGTQSHTGQTTLGSGASFDLFKDTLRNSYGSNMKISDFRIYDHALTANQVADLYNGGNGEVLPSTYQRVEYLQSTGTQFISFPITVDQTYKFAIDMQCVSSASGQYLWGRYAAEKSFFAYNASGVIQSGWGKAYKNSSTSVDTNRHQYLQYNDGTNGILMRDGVVISTQASAAATCHASSFFIFRGENQDGGQKVYSAKMYNGSKDIFQLIPCKRKSDNKPGMFDVVNNVFYTNAGTGEFTVGGNL